MAIDSILPVSSMVNSAINHVNKVTSITEARHLLSQGGVVPFGTSINQLLSDSVNSATSIFSSPIANQLGEIKSLVSTINSLGLTANNTVNSIYADATAPLANFAAAAGSIVANQIGNLQNVASIMTSAQSIKDRVMNLDTKFTSLVGTLPSSLDLSKYTNINVTAALAPITNAANLVTGGIQTMLGGIGSGFTSISDLTAHLQTLGANQISGLVDNIKNSAINAFGNVPNLSDSVAGLKNQVVGGVMGELNNLVASSELAVTTATQFIKGAGLVDLVTHPNPEVASAVALVTNHSVVDVTILSAANGSC